MRRVILFIQLSLYIILGAVSVAGEEEGSISVPRHDRIASLCEKGGDLWLADGRHIWHTSIARINWVAANSPAEGRQVHVEFVSTSKGWISRDDSLFETQDGGSHWQKLSFPKTFSMWGFKIGPDDDLWVYGENTGRALTKSEFLKAPRYTTTETADGRHLMLHPAFRKYKANGTKEDVRPGVGSGSAVALAFTNGRVAFADPWNIFVTNGNGSLFKPTNAGSQDVLPTAIAASAGEFWFGNRDGAVKRLAPGSLDWTTLGSIYKSHSAVEQLFFYTTRDGYALGNERLYESTDGGGSWFDLGFSKVETAYFDSDKVFVLTADKITVLPVNNYNSRR